MSELNLVSPLLDDFDTGGSISEHHGVSCYPAMRKESTDRYIIKKVSIPASQTKLDALLLTGAYPNKDAALSYFKEQADNTVKELEVLQRLAELEGFWGYEGWQIVPKENANGYDIYMIGTYKYSLRKHLQHHPATQLSALNLGLDMCAALSVCRQLGYLYVDLNPNNIYVEDDHYRIGDIGFLELDTLKYATLPEKYCSQYTAPEALDAFSMLTPTLDTYAIGLILYQIYNGGELPKATENGESEQFPAPAFADYEIAEIILKACDPNPEQRWQDPAELAQALVSYMQRNGVNDTPIVPPTVVLNDLDISEYEPQITAEDSNVESSENQPLEDGLESSAELEQPDPDIDLEGISELLDEVPETQDDPQYNEDDFGNLSFLNDLLSDETTPENNLEDVGYDEISDELSEIMNQADELVSHPVPETAITIEQPDIDSPEEQEDDDAPQDTFLETEGDDGDADNSNDDSGEMNMDETNVNLPNEDELFDDSALDLDAIIEGVKAEEENEIVEQDMTEPEFEDEPPKKKRGANWIMTVVIFILIAAIAAVGFFYYRTIYLLPINNITVDGTESKIIVLVDTDIDETMLSVICSDSHGNQLSAPVSNGTAMFSNLTPGTAYNVQIVVDGFHRLTGETAATYSTPALTDITQFTAVTGAEDGSAILSFDLEGPDTGVWQIAYSAPNEEEIIVDVLSHMVTVTNLTVGKEYTFKLIPGEGMYVIGTTEITHTASNVVVAEDVNIVSCNDNKMTIVWNTPSDVDVSSWTVRCYNDGEYNQTAITSENTIVFEEIDPATNYTVEVYAAGMSVCERAYMSANASTITNFAADTSTVGSVVLTWESNKPIPENGWVLIYSVDGSNTQSTISTEENSVTITPVIPDATYSFKIQHADGTAALSEHLSCETPAAQDFSGYGMERNTMAFRLCRRPADEWDWDDVADADFTASFSLTDKLGMVGELTGEYDTESQDNITTQFVIRDFEGNLIAYSFENQTWNSMWSNAHTELNIPQIPTEAGDYILTMYFNGKFVSQKAFSIS